MWNGWSGYYTRTNIIKRLTNLDKSVAQFFFTITVQKSKKMFVFLHNNDLDILHSNRAGNIHGDVHKFTQIAEDFYSLTWFLNTMAAADDGCDATNMRTRAHQLPNNWVVGRTTWGHQYDDISRHRSLHTKLTTSLIVRLTTFPF